MDNEVTMDDEVIMDESNKFNIKTAATLFVIVALAVFIGVYVALCTHTATQEYRLEQQLEQAEFERRLMDDVIRRGEEQRR